jgi:hypothetical protein
MGDACLPAAVVLHGGRRFRSSRQRPRGRDERDRRRHAGPQEAGGDRRGGVEAGQERARVGGIAGERAERRGNAWEITASISAASATAYPSTTH